MVYVASQIEWLFFELLLFSGFWFLIGALDDFLVDIIWIARRIFRRLVYYRRSPPMSIDHLPEPEQQAQMAVFIPTWNEAAVIGQMLQRCLNVWKDDRYLIYVGCYPNDEEGISAIKHAAQDDPRTRIIMCESPGPTTKADCLNHLWQAMILEELRCGKKMKAIILHDAEDMIHADELRLYDVLIEKNAVVQTPVIPIRVPGSRWVSGHYCDEFAESHGKSMVVREALGVPLPLAGVGCAIERNILGRIALENGNKPFDPESLTEDYELGIKIGRYGGKAILARVRGMQGDLVGTKACFPDTLDASVRQKTRWLTGIALAGWDRLGWGGSIAQFWMLCRDRKAIFAAVVAVAAYTAILCGAVLLILQLSGIRPLHTVPGNVRIVLVVNGWFLLWRLCVRAAFVWRLYGPAEAALSVPRIVVSNVIAILAARRAVFAYIGHCFGNRLSWDKTAHSHFPAEQKID
jgi:bacteriophage N4 adsorption protein B